jgi:hypothetical protein
MTPDRIARWAAGIGAVFWIVTGAWAFLAPKSFYDQVAVFPPYNRHFLHDGGAFALGLGATLVFAMVTRWDALRVALAGTGVAAALHVVAHAVDSDLGGRSTDIPGLVLVAAVIIVGALLRRADRVTADKT